jgi:hypothetical protein
MSIIRDWADRAEAFMKAKTKTGLMVLGLLSLILLLLQIFAQEWLGSHVVKPLAATLRFLAGLPMGVGGLVFFGTLTVLLLLAFFDTSPNAVVFKQWLDKKARGKEKPEVLSWEERQQIQAVRLFWNKRGGKAAADKLYILLGLVTSDLEQKNTLAPLLRLPLDAFQRAVAEVGYGIEDESTVPLDNIHNRINSALAEYGKTFYWLWVVDQNWLPVSSDPRYRPILNEWLNAHALCARGLEELNEMPEHRRLTSWEGAKDPAKLFAPSPPESIP